MGSCHLRLLILHYLMDLSSNKHIEVEVKLSYGELDLSFNKGLNESQLESDARSITWKIAKKNCIGKSVRSE